MAQTRQPYAYTGDDPVNYIDPLGLSWDDPSWAHSVIDRMERGADKVGHFVSTHKQAAVAIATVIATLPLDETGIGEAIDADVLGTEGTADASADLASDGMASEAAEEGSAEEADQAAENANTPSCPAESFTPSTLVKMANGALVPISSIKIGDKVLATDVLTGTSTSETVTATNIHDDNDLMNVIVKSPSGISTIHTTDMHPYWDLTTGSWTFAENLQPGDSLRTDDGAQVAVADVIQLSGIRDMWDLTVAYDHDFYVSVGSESSTAVLVHNCPSKAERLGQVFQRLNAGEPASSSSEALDNLSSTMNDVEDEAGIPAEDSPGLTSTERLYPPQADSITSFDDGSMLARIQGGYVNFSANGSIQVISGDAPTFFVPGAG